MRRELYATFTKVVMSVFALAALSIGVHAQGLTSYPYFQDFETYATCGVLCGTACPLPAGATNFTNAAGDDIDWTVDIGGTGSLNTGPSIDHTLGTSAGHYLYTETSGCNFDVANLLSPTFDFTALSAPTLNFWYHMYGATMGTMHLDISTDGGATWTLDIIPAWTDNTDLWQEQTVSLAAYAGVSNVVLRIRGITGSSFTSDMAVDDFLLFEPLPYDFGVVSFTSPATGGGLTTAEPVTACFYNYGSDTLMIGDTLDVSYSFGGMTFTETHTFTAPFLPGDTACHTFATTVDVSTMTVYNISGWTSYNPDDSNNLNDTLSTTFEHLLVISTFPYCEDFEAGDGGWSVNTFSGVSAWQLGTPASGVINTPAPGGTQSWETNLFGNYNTNDQSSVESPTYDFSAMTSDPYITMDIWWNSEFSWDGAKLQTSIDGGATWQTMGAIGSPTGTNWYNDNTINGFTVPAYVDNQTGWTGRATTGNGSGGWVQARHDLVGLAGESTVNLRVAWGTDGSVTDDGFAFDNVCVSEYFPIDMSMDAVVSPSFTGGGCLSTTNFIEVQITNQGTTPTSTPISAGYTMIDPSSTAVTVIEPTGVFLASGASTNYTYSAPYSLGASGTYTLITWVNIAGDGASGNDSLTTTFTYTAPITTYPYFEDFESGPGGWTVNAFTGTPSWQLGTPAVGVINSPAPGGTQSWETNLFGNYNTNEESYIQGPCFDFSGFCEPIFEMDVWWNSEFSWDGAKVQSSIDNGATWQTVGNFGDPGNWYTDNTINGFTVPAFVDNQEGWTGRVSTSNGSGGWVHATNDMTSLVGASSVLLRVAWGTDGSVTDDGFAFDNIQVRDNNLPEMELVEVLSPITGCALTANDSIKLTINNTSCVDWNNIPVTMTLNGGTPFSTIIPDNIPAYGSATVTLDTTLDLSALGTYYFFVDLAFAADPNPGNDTMTVRVENRFQPSMPTTTNDTTCGPGEHTLTASSDGDLTYWYSDMAATTLVGVGDTLNTTNSSTTTYYSQSITGGVDNVGRVNPVGTAGFLTTGFADGIFFEVQTDLSINNVTVYPGGAGDVTIRVLNGVGAVVATYTQTVSGAGPQVINCAFDLAPGLYRLDAIGTTTPGLYYNSAGAAYPYTITDVINLYQNNPNNPGWYSFFYDWEVAWKFCESPIAAAQAIVNNPPMVDLGPADTAFCMNTPYLMDVTNPNAMYSWSTGATTPAISANATDVYSVVVTDTVTTCVAADSIDITAWDVPNPDLGGDMDYCNGVELDASTPDAVSYMWNTGDTTSTILLGVGSSGTYYAFVTDDQGCVGGDTADVTINPLPTVNLGPDVVQCGGFQVLDALNPLATYSWNTGATTQFITVSSSDDYWVEVTDVNGCVNSDTVNVTIDPIPAVDLGPDRSLCANSENLDAGNFGSTYNWSGISSTSQFVSVTSSGTYAVTVTSPAGCTATDAVIITLDASAPVANNIPDTTVCNSVTLNVGGAPTDNILWSTGATTSTETISTSGSYWVEVSNACGNDIEGVDVTIDNPASASFTASAGGPTITFTNTSTGAGGSTTYSWDFGDGEVVNSSDATFSPTHVYNYGGTYTVTLTVTNACGTDTYTETVTVDGPAVGINDIELVNSISLYPNPTEDYINIEFEYEGLEAFNLQLVDARGRIVYNQMYTSYNGSFQERIYMGGFANGMYQMRITDGVNSAVKKVVVQH